MTQTYSTYVRVPEILLSDSLDFLGRHGIYCVLDLLGGHAATSGDKLSANVFRDGGGPVKAEKETSLELALGALDLDICRSCRHTGPLLQREVRHVVKVHQVLRDQINTPKTGIRVGRGERHEAVGEVVRGDDVGKTRRQKRGSAERPVPVAHDRLHDEHGEVVR